MGNEEVEAILVFHKKVTFVALRENGISSAAKRLVQVVLKEGVYSMEAVVYS